MTFRDLKEQIPWAVESEWHQHPKGGGWIMNTATVDDTAFIGDKALVYGEARVYDKALVYDKARVYGEARVYGKARVCGEALVYGEVNKNLIGVSGLLWPVWMERDGWYSVGCRVMSFADHVARYCAIDYSGSCSQCDREQIIKAMEFLESMRSR